MNTAELILNRDGSIYHLGLHPEQVAPVVITVGDPERVSRVSRYFDRIEHRVRRREFVTHTGWLGKQRLTVLSTGIGTDNVDIVLNELDALVNIDLTRREPLPHSTSLTIIRLGTTGSLQPDVPADSLVASTGAFGLDGLLQFYHAPEWQNHAAVAALRQHAAGRWDFPVAPYYTPGSTDLLGRLAKNFTPGITATCSGFYGPQGRRLRLPVRLEGYLDLLQTFRWGEQRIVNFEMETAGIYGLSALLGHRALSLSAVLAHRPSGTFSRNPAKVVKGLIEQVLNGFKG